MNIPGTFHTLQNIQKLFEVISLPEIVSNVLFVSTTLTADSYKIQYS